MKWMLCGKPRARPPLRRRVAIWWAGKIRGMDDDPQQWSDDDVKAYLIEQSPLEYWRVGGGDGGYGFVTEKGTFFFCADDWEERAIRIAAYLQKIGAPSLDDPARQSRPLPDNPEEW